MMAVLRSMTWPGSQDTSHPWWRPRGSEQLPELLGVHADDRQDVPQGALSNVAARVDRYDDRPAIGMTHHAMASADSHDLSAGQKATCVLVRRAVLTVSQGCIASLVS